MREEFAVYTTRKLRNFGVKATARTESAHAAVKGQLRNRKGDLHVLHTDIVDMLMGKQTSYEHGVNQQKYKTLPKAHRKEQYHELQGTVMHFDLGQLVKNEEYARDAIADPRG